MELDSFVRKLHESPHRFVLSATGGGSAAFSHLLQVPGASKTVLEALVPYASAALVEWLAARPESFCAPRTARQMAMAGYLKAQRLAKAEGLADDVPRAGIGCTCSLASDRPKRGAHRAHLALQNDRVTRTESLELAKGARTRREEEELVARWMLNLLAEGSGLAERLELGLQPGEVIKTIATEGGELCGLLSGSASRLWHGPAGRGPETIDARGIFPGAFNPPHEGHAGMRTAAERMLKGQVDFEISVTNVDKPPLDFTEMKDRLAKFGKDQAVWLTRAPTFVEKSRLFPGVHFLVGADTVTRIGDPRYYGGDPAARDRAIAEIASNHCRFLVFGRSSPRGFETLDQLELPPALAALSTGVPESEFRADVSSTELRRAAATAED